MFEEPLVPTGPIIDLEQNPDAQAENNDLARGLSAFLLRTKNEQVSALTDFLAAHPDSRWRGALQLNLGVIYRLTGRYSKAFDAFEDAWRCLKMASEPKAKRLADRALSELAELNARVGRRERLSDLISEASRRGVTGSATEKLVRAKEGLWGMFNTPEKSFLCGPCAVGSVKKALQADGVIPLDSPLAKSTVDGTSLEQINTLTQTVGLNLQMARRSPGAQVIVPSVVHWKVGHQGFWF